LANNNNNLSLFIGLRYSLSKRHSSFVSIVSAVSMLGMALGVTSLITVMSVMNGFSSELRGRILSAVPHGFIEVPGGAMSNWKEHREAVLQTPGVEAAAPYIQSNALLKNGYTSRGIQLTAIDPLLESTVSAVSKTMLMGQLSALSKQKFSIVLGEILANSMASEVGDNVTLVIPKLRITPGRVKPRSRRFTVVGIFEVGAQLDARQAYISLSSGQKIFALGESVHGLRVRVEDLYAAPAILNAVLEYTGADYQLSDWSQTQGSLFQAVRMEKFLVALLLFSVVAVAAFNIVSTLTMAVAEKRGDIAVLRTMGASRMTIATVFMVQGLFLATLGIFIGCTLGIYIACNITEIIAMLEYLLGFQVFDPAVYFISAIPSELQIRDVVVVCAAAFFLSLLAASYPAYRASKISPAEVLRYE
jgi:lipoprotein-releasing system permease protein